MNQKLYFDHAAATPTDEKVLQKMLPFFTDNFYNASATYQAGLDNHAALESARAQVAHWFGSRPSEVVFTAGGSEANNLAIHGVMRQYSNAHIVTSAIEHDSVLQPAKRYDFSEVAVSPQGRVDPQAVGNAVTDKTVLVSIMLANNEVGSIQPIREIASQLAEIRKKRLASGNSLPLLLHTDACQAGNYLDIHVARLGVDLMTINGSKIYGPKQTGALYVKGGVVLQPLVDGGGQERGLRSGTESVAQAVGLAAALDSVQTMRHDESRRLQQLQQQCFKLLTAASINGPSKLRLPNNVHVTYEGFDNERLLIQLDQLGIMAAAGSACSASSDEPSHVLKALGLSDAQAQASIRITFGRSTQLADVERLATVLNSLTVR